EGDPPLAQRLLHAPAWMHARAAVVAMAHVERRRVGHVSRTGAGTRTHRSGIWSGPCGSGQPPAGINVGKVRPRPARPAGPAELPGMLAQGTSHTTSSDARAAAGR